MDCLVSFAQLVATGFSPIESTKLGALFLCMNSRVGKLTCDETEGSALVLARS